MLLTLPDELLLAIANSIPSPHTLQSLASTCSRLYVVVLPAYYAALAKMHRCDGLVAAAVRGNLRAVGMLVGEVGRGRGRGRFRGYVRGRKYGKGSALVAAIELGRTDIALLVLQHGADANADAGPVGNALEAACDRRETEIVLALLRYGADVGYGGTRGGRSALLIAAGKGYGEIVQMLVDHGADVGAETGPERMFPLRAAAVGGHLGCVEVLVGRGADVNYRNAIQGRALEGALEAEHEDVVKFLIEQGAEDRLVEGLDDKWLPGAAFNIVSRRERWRGVLDAMLDRMDYSSQLAGNAFISVARDGNVDLVEHFLRNGVDLEKHGPRALGVASVKGHVHILHRLLPGVDVTQEVPKRGSALLRAAHHGHVDCVKLLLSHGASPNAVFGTPRTEWRGYSRAVFCSTPLQAACWGRGYTEKGTKYEDIARMLLEAGADPNVSGARWFHPLNLAAYRRNEAIVRLLLEHGSNPSARGPVYGDNALQAAVQSRSIDIVRVLLEHGAEMPHSGALQAACGAVYPNEGDFQIVKLLLDHGADPNDRSDAYVCTGYINALAGQQPGSRLWSALEVARRGRNGRNDTIIQLLLDRGGR